MCVCVCVCVCGEERERERERERDRNRARARASEREREREREADGETRAYVLIHVLVDAVEVAHADQVSANELEGKGKRCAHRNERSATAQ